MSGILESVLLLGLGSLSIARNEAETLLKEALKRQNIPEGDTDSILKAVKEEGVKTKKVLEDAVSNILQSRGASLCPAYKRLEVLEARVAELEAKLASKNA